jgi:hypothetical protein
LGLRNVTCPPRIARKNKFVLAKGVDARIDATNLAGHSLRYSPRDHGGPKAAPTKAAIMKLTSHRSSSVVQAGFQRQLPSASSMTAGTKKTNEDDTKAHT